MNCEIEFLPVGDGSKPGDAIVIRYGEPDAYELMIVDGGNIDSGKEIVKHIHAHFGQNILVSHVVLTHCDADHASGLREVLRELPVVKLWLHLPWTFAAEARPYFANKNWTDKGLEQTLREEYDIIGELVQLAVNQATAIEQPFAGAVIGPFRVLSPYRGAYPLLLPQFDRTPDADEAALQAANFWIGKPPGVIAALVEKVAEKLAEKVQAMIPETWETERLKDGGVTSATNETSVVLYGECSAGKVLLTGDAGVWGFAMAQLQAKQMGISLPGLSFVQIPHHGSRRNIGPTTLNALLGPIRAQDAPRPCLAFVSAPKDDSTHPRRMVLNAFMRRGCEYQATQGQKKVFWGGFPPRPGYVALSPCEFNYEVEDYD